MKIFLFWSAVFSAFIVLNEIAHAVSCVNGVCS